MKNITLVIKSIAVSLALVATASSQAAELVKVESTNNFAFTANLSADLAQSVKQLKKVTVNAEKSAESILVAQNKKQYKTANTTTVTLVAAAE